MRTDPLDEGNLGPAMLALRPKQRGFVMALYDNPYWSHTAAAAFAGFQGDNNTLRVTGHRLAHDAKVICAYNEMAERRMRGCGMMSAAVVEEILRDVTHKDRAKVAFGIFNRIGLHERTEHKVIVERPTDDIEVKARIVALAKELGIDPRSLLGNNAQLPMLEAPIDVEFSEVETSNDGLEDLV